MWSYSKTTVSAYNMWCSGSIKLQKMRILKLITSMSLKCLSKSINQYNFYLLYCCYVMFTLIVFAGPHVHTSI